MVFQILDELQERFGQNHNLHEHHLNSQYVKMLQTIGYNKIYHRASGPYLFDSEGHKYLDLLSGFGVFALGRNHPRINAALQDILSADLPDMVQLDCSLLSGLLAEKLLQYMPPTLDKVFFANSGTEVVEAAIKFSRMATGRKKVVYCEHAFHGLTLGSLSLNGDNIFREGFGPLLPDCHSVPFNDSDALARILRKKDVACFVVEPIQGKGVHIPDETYLPEVSELCKKYGTLLVVDEIQTGMGRTGKFLALEHWQKNAEVDADIITLAKALSGGYAPVGALVTKKWIFNKVFSRMDKAVIHGSTFAKNNLGMAAGLTTLYTFEEEKLIERAEKYGELLLGRLQEFVDKYQLVKEVRGKGMMIGIEFGPPQKLSLKTSWELLECAKRGLFCQMITIPLFKKHRIISQVAGHESYVVKLLPPYIIDEEDIDWICNSFDEVIADAHRVPGGVWNLAKNLAQHALCSSSILL